MSTPQTQQFRTLQQQLANASNEEEVRLAWVRAIEAVPGIVFSAERGRRDLSYNNVVIEFKGPGKFNGRTTSAAFKEAIQERLLPYIRKTAKAEHIDESDYIGIAIDDTHLAFAQVVDGEVTHDSLLPITQRTFGLVVQACRTCHRRAITATNLIEDFGHESVRGIALMRAMADALSAAKTRRSGTKVQMLFEEWRTLYGQVADLSKEQLNAINGTLRFARATNRTEVSERLFVVHTFNSLLMKLLAAQITAAHGLASGRTFAADLVTTDADTEFLARIREDIEQGGFFEATGIHGFVEEAIFSWYLDAATNARHRASLSAAIRDILTDLSLYRTDRLDHARDVLRDFYQDLVPDVLRKSLGEFYTPDWLVKHTVNQLHVRNWIDTRAIDPTCGSGSFLVELIARKRLAASKHGMTPSATVRMIIDTVWGFDLNPLAVQASRTNFLMAMADLLKAEPGQQIEIPVLLADAVYSPARLPDADEDLVEYQVGSQNANLKILLPAALAFDRLALDRVFEVMAELVSDNAAFTRCARALLSRGVLNQTQLQDWSYPLKWTYDQVLRLHRQNWNGIWFRIVRNYFRSANAGRFDVIVGNPPWIRWSKLPDAYRERAKPTCEQYNIFSETPYHGGNELDISGMITYTTADKWLKPNGKLAFVLTQTHFQSPSSQGFRRFWIDHQNRLAPLVVDDMKGLRPFAEAANKTSVAVFRKTKVPPKYPVPYRVWTPSSGQVRLIPSSLPLPDVMRRVRRRRLEATPVGSEGSPWAILEPGRFAALSSISGRSDWVHGRKGITTDLNGLYFVNITATNSRTRLVRVQTRPEAGRTDIGPPRIYWVEPTFLHPLLKGAADFDTCFVGPSHGLFAFVPNRGISREAYEDAERHVNTSCPKTRTYLRAYETSLRERSTWIKRMPTAPFYAVYNVGAYTFAPYKVVWAEQSGEFKAAVAANGSVPLIGQRPYVPDHKIFFVDFNEPEPAYFLCGLLSAPLVREFVESHNISIQVGNIFKHMSLPSFNVHRRQHTRLAEAVRKAHLEPDPEARAPLVHQLRSNAEQLL